MLILWTLQQIGHIHKELLKEPNFFHLPQTAWDVLLGASCSHVPPHHSRQPCSSSAQSCLAPGPSFSVLPSHETGWHCHFATPEEVRAGGPSIQQQSKVEAEQRATLSIEGVSFLFPSPANCLTHQSLTQGAFCSLSFIPEDVVEGWKKAWGSAVVLTDDICSLASVSSIHP